MIVPLTLADFLERAELVYGDRQAIVDEPGPPGGGLGRLTYRSSRPWRGASPPRWTTSAWRGARGWPSSRRTPRGSW